MRETAEERAERYLREGRTVSGGGGPSNPPDKPYVVKTLSADDDLATSQLQAARNAGFEVLFAFSDHDGSGVTHTRVILGNYEKGK